MKQSEINNLGTLSGLVKHGRGEGNSLGFRTANLVVASSEIPVSEGVYSAYVFVDGQTFRAAVSVGVSPLFKNETNANVEAHILNFSGDLYNKRITIQFCEFLRPMIAFSSKEDLISTVKHNIEQARQLPLSE